MKVVADLHIHSKYSRATSPQMNLEDLDKWAKFKGIDVLATGDFTHPEWFSILKEKLESAEPGLFKIKDSRTRFILNVEISSVYKKGEKVRKIHNLVFSPSFEAAEKINAQLGWIGNLKSDGRPILGLDSKELAKIVFNISKDCFIVPCHIWTPWFSLFGSKSGFDSIEECFEEYSKYIFAVETGISSDPAMNWRLSELDNITLLSNSDAHSPAKIGREANIFELEDLSYFSIKEAILDKDPKRFLSTIEFYPQEGRYHYDGHRKCNIRLSPEETKKYNNICPVCGKELTLGVLGRVEKLADRPKGFKPEGAIPFYSLIPLIEVVAESLGMTTASNEVSNNYFRLVKEFRNEFNVLLNASRQDIEKIVFPEIAEGIIRMREGKVFIDPGYDGVYGKVRIFSKEEKGKDFKQETLF